MKALANLTRTYFGFRYNIHSLLFKVMFLTTIILLSAGMVRAQESYEVIRGESSSNSWLQFTGVDNALYHHLAGQGVDLMSKRSDKIAELNSLSDWQARQQEIKKTLKEVIGPFPAKTPLNATVDGAIKKDGYRIEHIVYESQPGFHVTSSLFIPDGVTEQAPAVIYTSGHTSEGYRSDTYQHVILNLVKKGFIVFAFDPVGQGERLQYYEPEAGRSTVGGPTSEHSYSGAQAFITGSSQARYMIWDGIRAVDYLLSRPEVDSSRIGITGRSGGGTQSAYIAAMDERIYAAAPENYITSFTRLLQSIGPQDAEQNLYHGIAAGIDHADLLAVRVPRPALMITTTNDMFSIQGARETANEVSEIYKVYDKEDNFSIVEDMDGHTSTQKNRQAMYAFFQQHLDNPGNPDDLDVPLLTEEELQVTRTGQEATSLEGETVFSLNRKQAQKWIDTLQTNRKRLGSHIPKAVKAAKELSGYQDPEKRNEPVFSGSMQQGGYVIEKYYVEGEGDYPIPYLLMLPEQPNGKGLLYLHPSGKGAEAAEGGQMEWFVQQGFTVLAPDLPGVGEMAPGDFRGNFYIENTHYGIWFASQLIGRSIAGIQAGDAVRLSRLLLNRTQISDVYGLARRQMGPALLHAAAFDPSISRVALWEPYSSYRSIVMNRKYNPAFISSTVAGALTAYDLPDLAASLAPRKLLMAGVTDGLGNTGSQKNIREQFSIIRTAYQGKNAADNLTITWDTDEKVNGILEQWIK